MSLTTSAAGLRSGATGFVARHGMFSVASIGLLNLTAIGIMAWTETTPVSKLVFILTWGLVNCLWLTVTRRPAIAGALSLLFFALLIAASEFKYQVLWMTLNFVDLMVVDADTAIYLFTVFPSLVWWVVAATAVLIPALALIWWFDPLRMRIAYALAGFTACFLGIVTLSSAWPMETYETFYGQNYVSTFARTGVAAVSELMTRSMLESDAVATGPSLSPGGGVGAGTELDAACAPAAKPPHIILVHDESSFDIRSAPGIDVPRGYGAHFKSFDGKQRNFLVEGVGGPSWYAEYSVLTGLSARSFGRFSYYVLGIASGRVLRGLPAVLRRCGYQTHTLFPALGAFLNSRSFETSVGVQKFSDKHDLGAQGLEPDKFFYDKALGTLESERGTGPQFIYVYLGANHFPWDFRYHPELMPQWKDLNNPPFVNEYIRRQMISAADYKAFLAGLKEKFPGEPFLILRYGDHQPDFSDRIMEPGLDEKTLAGRMMNFDPKYYTTYYAIDAINFKLADVSSALPTLDGPFLPLVTLEAAGLPLDPSFVEQKNILKRCSGIFYACNGGAEARRFNRLLIDAGLIKQL